MLTASVPRLVLETLEPLADDRKCFRMINGVLVERTVKDIVPALKTNSEGLRKVLEDLVKQYNSKQIEMDKWKVGPSIDLWISADSFAEEEQYSGRAAMSDKNHNGLGSAGLRQWQGRAKSGVWVIRRSII